MKPPRLPKIPKFPRIFPIPGIGRNARPLVSTLDLYIIRKFLGTYVFAIILILAITVRMKAAAHMA